MQAWCVDLCCLMTFVRIFMQIPSFWALGASAFSRKIHIKRHWNKNKISMFPKLVVIYFSHAIGHGSMRAHGAARRRARASEHRVDKRRDRDTEPELYHTKYPPNVCLFTLQMNNPHIPMSASWHSECKGPGFHPCKDLIVLPRAERFSFSGEPPFLLSSSTDRWSSVLPVFTRCSSFKKKSDIWARAVLQ